MSDNEIIAEFMGHDVPNGYLNGSDRNSKYDTSWDWLMPVVEKIERIKGVHLVISELGCDIYSFGKRVSDSREDTKIKTVYKAVVSFIKWYSNQPQKAS